MERLLYRFPEGFGVVEDGRLVEYIDLRETTQSGSIILAKVDRMMKGMEFAFADIGRKKDGFLPLTENGRSFTDAPVKSGDRVAVQIRKEETGGKGAYLSRDLSIPGRCIILMPKNRYIGVSNRIQDESTRNRLRILGRRIADGQCGLVMRSTSEHAGEKEILSEFTELKECWKITQEKIRHAAKPGEILYEPDPVAQIIRDYNVLPEAVWDAPEMTSEMIKQLEISRKRTVKLPGGADIVIDRCEAMTVVDVNTASAHFQGDKESIVTATNLEACSEAAIQIRLRDIAGIIMIDFIDMDCDENRTRVEQKIREIFSRDRRKTVIHGWTKLGILEMTRKRI